MNIAVILAGGTGTRMQSEMPKQFIEVDGKTIIEHSIDAFEQNDDIDRICVVMHPEYFGKMEDIIVRRGWLKLKDMVAGGNERFLSSYNAVKYFAHQKDDNIILHDAARYKVSQKIINDVVKALSSFRTVTTAIPMTDTLLELSDDKSSVYRYVNRDFFMRVQTPQGFKISVIYEAFGKALKDENFHATDDCSVVKKYLPDEIIHIVRGEESNIKVTYKEDIRQSQVM